ncbi:MAG: DUF72 domain-containing protein [Planctomycetota bacterium]|nr:DUF72 domain-containing protein [Planctomycetota bacterium]
MATARSGKKGRLLLGTSSWSSKDWVGTIYPEGCEPRDYLPAYARQFSSVEIDSTWYRSPSEYLVRKWDRDTPVGFIFSAKVPRSITHEKVLIDCRAELSEFLGKMDILGDKLGPLLFQFPYGFKSSEFETLASFLSQLPSGYRFVVEVRHKSWLGDPFFDLLERHQIPLALIDHPWMPRLDRLTGPYAFVRWLGDRKGIEKKTKTWDRLIVNRTEVLKWWAEKIQGMLASGVDVFGYFNNHYAGYAPGSLEGFMKILEDNPVPKPS